jgi:hypothetical protein
MLRTSDDDAINYIIGIVTNNNIIHSHLCQVYFHYFHYLFENENKFFGWNSVAFKIRNFLFFIFLFFYFSNHAMTETCNNERPNINTWLV